MVALRCALVRGRDAVLFAGCGIVADSDPAREWDESRLKLRTMIGGPRRRGRGSPVTRRRRAAGDRRGAGRCRGDRRHRLPRVALDAPRAGDAGSPRVAGPRAPGRAIGRVLRARAGASSAAAGRVVVHLGHGRRRAAASRRRGLSGARAARHPHRRPAARASRPRRAADDRSGGHLRPHVRWSVDLPLLDGAAETRRHVRSVVGRAVATARGGPAGPVHLNIGFREPLVPSDGLGPLTARRWRDGRGRHLGRRWASECSTRLLSGTSPARIAAVRARPDRRGAAGRPGTPRGPGAPRRRDRVPDRRRPAVGRALRAARPLVRADPCRPPRPPRSVARCPHPRPRHPLRRDDDLEADADPARERDAHPDRGRPRSRLERPGDHPDHVRPGRRDRRPRMPSRTSSRARGGARGPSLVRCRSRRGRRPRRLAGRPRGARRAVRGPAVRLLGGLLPDGAPPVGRQQHARPRPGRLAARSARAIRPLSNRGANGIDGVVSTALGAAAADAVRSRSSSATCRSCTT